MTANPDVDACTKSLKHRKILRKTQKNNLLKNKRTTKTVIQAEWGPGFYI